MDSNQPVEVVVVDIRMHFWSMVFFMVKWVLASIPALIILVIISVLLSTLFTGLTGMGHMGWWHGHM